MADYHKAPNYLLFNDAAAAPHQTECVLLLKQKLLASSSAAATN